MLYREIIAVCSQIHSTHINTLCGQNGELLNVSEPLGCKRLKNLPAERAVTRHRQQCMCGDLCHSGISLPLLTHFSEKGNFENSCTRFEYLQHTILQLVHSGCVCVCASSALGVAVAQRFRLVCRAYIHIDFSGPPGLNGRPVA